MKETKKNTKILLPILLVALLIAMVGGVTYAFFNYTRTGVANTLQVGRIAFNSTQNNTIRLENVFPTSSTSLNSNNSDTVTITITGDTTYSEGIEYKVTLEDVNNTINGKEVPISIRATATNLGTSSSNYYTDRTNKTKIYKLNSEGDAYNGKYILVGYIPTGEEGVNGSIDITAFIDTNKVAITDTLENGPIVETGYVNGTTDDWVLGREVFTTTEWNSFNSSNPLSFKVKVEANEGIWVEQEKFLTMKRLPADSNWKTIRANITSIEFHKDGVIPASYVTSFDVTDTTSDPSKGNITLYTVDDGLGNNTYKAIIVANDTIYAPVDSTQLFALTKIITFNSKNFKVDNVNNMSSMFGNCPNLINLNNLSTWNTDNVTNMSQMFRKCTNLIDTSGLINWNTSNVIKLNEFFRDCSNLVNINGVSKWNVENVETFTLMFAYTKINNVNALLDWNLRNYTLITQMFRGCSSLNNLDGLRKWNVSKLQWFTYVFSDCSNLEDASGINDWDILEPQATFDHMFSGTPVHPEFTKVYGTWDENGTFTPNA